MENVWIVAGSWTAVENELRRAGVELSALTRVDDRHGLFAGVEVVLSDFIPADWVKVVPKPEIELFKPVLDPFPIRWTFRRARPRPARCARPGPRRARPRRGRSTRP